MEHSESRRLNVQQVAVLEIQPEQARLNSFNVMMERVKSPVKKMVGLSQLSLPRLLRRVAVE